jgi:DNA-binding NtrC family response regulator
LVEIGASAPLLANEALSVLIDTNDIVEASIVARENKGGEKVIAAYSSPELSRIEGKQPFIVRIDLGVHGRRTYELIVLPRSTASARSTVLAVQRLIHSSLALARARQTEKEQSALWPMPRPAQQLGLICASDRTLELLNTIRRVAASNITVLLTGETGVGKELFARALHQTSSRSEKVFLPFNCSTVPRDMLDSQLFGHKRGSFTGAQLDAPGMIRSAAGGTLFLDEIGEMPVETQPKLLRFLESGEILPLGEPKPQIVDVRIVAATNANLNQWVADGRFREDLYYRLNVIRIDIPPLRERREEIPALVEHFLEKFGRELQKPMLRIADETLEYLVLYRWPGNVRQLSNEIRRLVAMAEPGGVLMPAHLADDIAASRRTVAVNTAPRLFNEVITRIDQPLSAAVEHIERAAIQRALSMTDGRLDEAAKMLGLSRKGLYLKRQRLNLG